MLFSVPRRLEIGDLRINVLYYVCQVFVLGLLSFLTVRHNLHLAVHSDGNAVNLVPYISPMSASTLRDITENTSQSVACANSEDLWYDWELGSRWRYRPTGCLRVCSSGNAEPTDAREDRPCVPQENLVVRANRGVFVPTLLQFTSTTGDGRVRQESLFSPYADYMTLHFSIDVYSEVPTWRGGMSSYVLKGDTSNGLVTVVVDSLGRVDSVWDKSCELSMMSIFRLCGLSKNHLDEDNMLNRMNQNASQKKPYPANRVVGLEIVTMIDCKNDIPKQITEGADLLREWKSRMKGKVSVWCTMRFVVLDSRTWGERDQTSRHGFGAGQTTDNSYDLGIYIRFQTSLEVTYLEPFRASVYLASACEYLRWPRVLLAFFLTFCLGPVSAMYRRAIVKEFSLPKTIVDFAARLVHDKKYGSFARLTKAEGARDKPELASQLVQLASELEEFNEMSAAAFAYFICRTLEDRKTRCASQAKQSDAKVKALLEISNQTEAWTIKHAGHMFNVDRNVCIFERIFAPRFYFEARRCTKNQIKLGSVLADSGHPLSDQEGMVQTSPMAKSSTQFEVEQIVKEKSSDLCLEQRWEQHQREVLEKFDRLQTVMDDVLGRLTRVESELGRARTLVTRSDVDSLAPFGLGNLKVNLEAPLETPRAQSFHIRPQIQDVCQRENSQCIKSENDSTDKYASNTAGASAKTSTLRRSKRRWSSTKSERKKSLTKREKLFCH
eukprot:TRINITY_DN7989_c0_g1_i12.p1 TRINITY_DN7989_c0_g1~~TRINITY_DN7989_c0_g1_i12.p1  ORF type:complete len:723 (-),score=62.04 TRINITY_DN7989_c0_g1_i12:185-2353(-)